MILLIVLAVVFALANLVCLSLLIYKKCCQGYSKVDQVELGKEAGSLIVEKGAPDESVATSNTDNVDVYADNMVDFDGDERTDAVKIHSADDHQVKYISSLRESSAENSFSDVEAVVSGGRSFYGSSSGTLSAYGDTGTVTGSMMSVASKASWNGSQVLDHLDLNIQSSLIYSKDLRYVAGKITQVNGLRFGDATGESHPSHVRVHVVILPVKKYALKTNWYSIPPNGRIKIGEYFKFLFKLPPSESKTMLRVRLYGRKSRVGMLGRPRCMGEMYVTLQEVVNARGGLTLSRGLSRGVSNPVLEG